MVSIPREILMRILGFGDFDNRDGLSLRSSSGKRRRDRDQSYLPRWTRSRTRQKFRKNLRAGTSRSLLCKLQPCLFRSLQSFLF